MNQRVYTLDQAAEQLQVKPRWLQRKCAAAAIPHTRLAGQLRFTDAHLEAIIAQFEEQPQAAAPRPGPKSRRPRQGASVTRLQAKTPPRLRNEA